MVEGNSDEGGFYREDPFGEGPGFADQSTIKDIHEELDQTQVYLRLIRADRNLDRVDKLVGLFQQLLQVMLALTDQARTSPEVKKESHQTYKFLVEKFLKEERSSEFRRLRSQLRSLFGKDTQQLAFEKAREEVEQLNLKKKGEQESVDQFLQQTKNLLTEVNEELNDMLEGEPAGRGEEGLEAIRDQLRNDGG